MSLTEAAPPSVVTVAWLSPADHEAARRRWPAWRDQNTTHADLAERMEGALRVQRAMGNGPITVIPLPIDAYEAWCTERAVDPADNESRGTYATELHDEGAGAAWPPGRNDSCWCGSTAKYKRCCGAV